MSELRPDEFITLHKFDNITTIWPRCYLKIDPLNITLLTLCDRKFKQTYFVHVCTITSKNINQFLSCCISAFEHREDKNFESEPFDTFRKEVVLENSTVTRVENITLAVTKVHDTFYCMIGTLYFETEKLNLLAKSVTEAIISSIGSPQIRLIYDLSESLSEKEDYQETCRNISKWKTSEVEFCLLLGYSLEREEKVFLATHIPLIEAEIRTGHFINH